MYTRIVTYTKTSSHKDYIYNHKYKVLNSKPKSSVNDKRYKLDNPR